MVGVDIEPQPHYCGDEFYQADALEYLLEHGHKYDAIHASPPCQKYTGMRNITMARFGHVPDHPDLIGVTRAALEKSGKPYIIENVQNAPLHTQFTLCGSALGLPHLARHRLFESNIMFWNIPKCNHVQEEYTIGIYGEQPDGRRVSYKKTGCVELLD